MKMKKEEGKRKFFINESIYAYDAMEFHLYENLYYLRWPYIIWYYYYIFKERIFCEILLYEPEFLLIEWKIIAGKAIRWIPIIYLF